MKQISMTSVTTSAIWIFCLIVGVIGVLIPYHRSEAAAAKPSPIQAELINVALTSDPTPINNPAPAKPAETIAAPPTAKLTLAPAAALTPVAAPGAAIAFELPVAGPTQIVEAKNAAYSAPQKPAEETSAHAPVTQLTFGQGEGKQFMDYPARAKAEGQEGTVRVEFTVGADGRTVAAEIVARCQWQLLNDHALKNIRERWRFAPGPVRRYVVPIHFRLTK